MQAILFFFYTAHNVLLTPLPFQFYFPPPPCPPRFLSFSLFNVFIPSSIIILLFSLLHLHLLIYSIYFPSTNTSTSYRPHIDPTSTPHRPYIDPTSTPHRLHIDPTSTPHRPHVDPTSTLQSTFLTQLRE